MSLNTYVILLARKRKKKKFNIRPNIKISTLFFSSTEIFLFRRDDNNLCLSTHIFPYYHHHSVPYIIYIYSFFLFIPLVSSYFEEFISRLYFQLLFERFKKIGFFHTSVLFDVIGSVRMPNPYHLKSLNVAVFCTTDPFFNFTKNVVFNG